MIQEVIHEFVNYCLNHDLVKEYDVTYLTNKIIGILKIDSFNIPFVRCANTRIIDDILEDLLKYAIDNKLIEDFNVTKDLFDTLIMDTVTPLPSTILDRFNSLYKESPSDATNYLYKLMIDVNYIRDNRNKKNIIFNHNTKYGDLIISINLSKPEKDPKLIIQAGNTSSNKYPQCQLCYENVGYYGRLDHPARNNLRVIPVKINNEDFYFQYSPYAYFNEHCIVFKAEHEPMHVCHDTYVRLFDFIDLFPHYFLGSNAGLPIVGGSILAHEHYQGGNFIFPLDKAETLYSKNIGNVLLEYLNWPLDVIRLSSKSKDDLLKQIDNVTDVWRKYSNEAINIIANDGTPHNAITPIARKNGDTYVINLILRNNLTTPDHPYGLYHPDVDLHHIKKENIGLIETAGLAILPGRLKNELTLLDNILKGNESESRLSEIEIHRDWYNELKAKNTPIDINYEVGVVFTKVLESCEVFKYGSIEDVLSFIDLIK